MLILEKLSTQLFEFSVGLDFIRQQGIIPNSLHLVLFAEQLHLAVLPQQPHQGNATYQTTKQAIHLAEFPAHLVAGSPGWLNWRGKIKRILVHGN